METLHRVAAVFSVLTPVGVIVLAILKRTRIITPSPTDSQLVVAIICLAGGGLLALIIGVASRLDIYSAFDGDGYGGTVAFVLGILLLLGALAGLLVL